MEGVSKDLSLKKEVRVDIKGRHYYRLFAWVCMGVGARQKVLQIVNGLKGNCMLYYHSKKFYSAIVLHSNDKKELLTHKTI